MKYLRALMAGIFLPAIVFPTMTIVLLLTGNLYLMEILPLYIIPFLWALWNVLYFAVGRKCPIKDQNPRLFVHGATLGFIIAAFAVFIFKIDQLLFGCWSPNVYSLLIIAPLGYGLLWRFLVKPLNKLAGLKDW